MIQNADDAGATEVKFMIDNREHSRDDLPPKLKGLDKFQGPALLSWNNAVFSEGDWESISKIYQSTKENEPMKVGRFGLGFISIYHITGEDCTYALYIYVERYIPYTVQLISNFKINRVWYYARTTQA